MSTFTRPESLILGIGRFVSTFSLIMMLLTLIIVVMRYGLKIGEFQLFGWPVSTIIINETVMFLHAMLFMLASTIALQQDQHVRVDVLYRKFSSRGKSLVNILGTLFLLFPMCGLILWTSWDYVSLSWQINEHSPEAQGLPYLYLLKSLIPLMSLLLIAQGGLEIIKHSRHLLGKREFPYANGGSP